MMTQPLTIVIVADHGSVTGGQAKVAIDSALGLQAADIQVIYFAAASPVDPRLEQAGIEVVCLGQTDLLGNSSRVKGMIQGTWNATAASALGVLLARLPPDSTIVHVHGWAKALSPAISAPIRSSGLPAIYTMHEYFLHCPNGGFYNYQTHNACQLKPFSAACLVTHCDQRNYVRKLWRSGRLWLANHVARLPQVFSDIVLLSDLQEQVLAPYLPKDAIIHRVSNPVEVDQIGQKENRTKGDFLFVGRLSVEKGALLFAEAAKRAGVTPVFIGDGPNEQELRRRFPDARLLGWCAPSEVRVVMRDARALVFPSLWYETFGLTVLEAQALGTPTIVASDCAARESVKDGVTGLWFASGNIDSLAEAMMRMKDDSLVSRLSVSAYEAYWNDPPTLKRHTEQLVAIYKNMRLRRSQAP
jgi:glycosyltransferase involved in cell wall biosynthesis